MRPSRNLFPTRGSISSFPRGKNQQSREASTESKTGEGGGKRAKNTRFSTGNLAAGGSTDRRGGAGSGGLSCYLGFERRRREEGEEEEEEAMAVRARRCCVRTHASLGLVFFFLFLFASWRSWEVDEASKRKRKEKKKKRKKKQKERFGLRLLCVPIYISYSLIY